MKTFISSLFLVLSSLGYSQYFLKQDVFSGSYLEAYEFTEYNDHMYFLGESEVVNRGIYKINGEVGNVELLEDSEGNVLDGRAILGVYNDKLYFSASLPGEPKEIWSNDGSSAGSVQFSQFSTPGASEPGIGARYMAVLNDQMIFHASDLNASIGNELYISDGTPAGTQLLADINPDGDGIIGPMYKWNNVIYFIGTDGMHGKELWRTDGTESGTFMLKDFHPEVDGMLYLRPLIYDNKMWFIALSDGNGMELWYTDGTEEGTEMLTDLFPGGESGIPYSSELILFNDRIYFTGNDVEHDHELFSTDGTADGTELAVDLAPGDAGSFPREITLYDNKLYFAADAEADIDEPNRLWVTDGTAEGTVQQGSDLDLVSPRNFKVFEDKLVFTSQGPNYEDLLWNTDGTTSGITELYPENVDGDWQAQYYGEHFIFGGRLFLEAVLDGEADLWSYGSSDINLNISELPNILSVKVYPNPSNGYLRIDSAEKLKQVSVFGSDGKMHKRLLMQGFTGSDLDLKELNNGMYFLEISSENSRAVRKVLIHH